MTAPDPQTDIDSFVRYVAQFEPSWPSRIRGASEEKRAQFHELSGVRSPDLYEGFLTRLGEDPGGLRFFSDTSSRIDDLLDYYREARAQSPSWIPPDSIVIGVGGVAVQEVSLHPASAALPRVVLSDNVHVGAVYAQSLASLLYRGVFQDLQVERSRVRIAYGNSGKHDPLAGALGAIAADLGFVQQWFSDDISYCGVRQSTALFSFQPARAPLAVVVGAVDEATAATVGDAIGLRMGLRRLQTRRAATP